MVTVSVLSPRVPVLGHVYITAHVTRGGKRDTKSVSLGIVKIPNSALASGIFRIEKNVNSEMRKTKNTPRKWNSVVVMNVSEGHKWSQEVKNRDPDRDTKIALLHRKSDNFANLLTTFGLGFFGRTLGQNESHPDNLARLWSVLLVREGTWEEPPSRKGEDASQDRAI